MLQKDGQIEGTPTELLKLLNQNSEAKAYFESLARSHKQAYCNWIDSAKKEETRKKRAEKALIMLLNKQKT